MRVNVYAEELTKDVSLVIKQADTSNEFIGVRFTLESATALHYRAGDDDRSAVTFWVPGSKQKGYKLAEVIAMFDEAAQLLRNATKQS